MGSRSFSFIMGALLLSSGAIAIGRSVSGSATIPIVGVAHGQRIDLGDGVRCDCTVILGPNAVTIDTPEHVGRFAAVSWRLSANDGSKELMRGTTLQFLDVSTPEPPELSFVGPVDASDVPEGHPLTQKMVGIKIRPMAKDWGSVADESEIEVSFEAK